MIGLTGTLLNGYADGLFYILYKIFPHVMLREGYAYNDCETFAKDLGVHKRLKIIDNTTDKTKKTTSKKMPGVSPLVFTKFLLENAAFISLDDISDGLPGYQEIPVGVEMDYELDAQYESLTEAVRECLADEHQDKGRVLFNLFQLMSVYPDMPYNQKPIYNPISNRLVFSPENLSDGLRNKENRLLELVKEKVDAGEKVLIYTQWTNRTDVNSKLGDMLKHEGIKSVLLKSSVKSELREEWINKQVEAGIDVLICNPQLVETGLDLLDFTTIIFYQVGYNLFTMRQASRRSWRLSQERDIEVYFMYYKNTIQEQALGLMASKLQAAQAIEGKFTEEGLQAMSENDDILTQIASNIVDGIKGTVDAQVFQKNGNTKKRSEIVAEEAQAEAKKTAISITKYATRPCSLFITNSKKQKTKTNIFEMLDNPLLVANA